MIEIDGLTQRYGGKTAVDGLSFVVNGKHYPEAAAPMSELGILLDARSVHPGLSARSNLLALARTAGIGRRRVDEVIELAGLGEVAGTRPAASPSA